MTHTHAHKHTHTDHETLLFPEGRVVGCMLIWPLVLAYVKSGDLPVAHVLCVVCFFKIIWNLFSFVCVFDVKALFLQC